MFPNLYIHVPFCRSKCDYCAFYSMPSVPAELVERWLNKLEQQLAAAEFGEPVRTVFIGGGTPTLLAEPQLRRLLEAIHRYAQPEPDAEISIECNPETLTPEKLELLVRLVTRLSLGVQSFRFDHRKTLGRHTGDEAITAAIAAIRQLPLQFNIDLIYGIPGQTLNDWRKELETVCTCGVTHLSCYSLTVEEGTALAAHSETATAIDDELSTDMWELAGTILNQAGLPRYEVSNYAKPGSECRHNRNIWYGGQYLGLGPAATSFDGRHRWTQPASVEQWLAGQPPETDVITPQARLAEIFAVGLRTAEGWTRQRWDAVEARRFGDQTWEQIIGKAQNLYLPAPGLLDIKQESIRLTPKGILFWDLIAEAWLE